MRVRVRVRVRVRARVRVRVRVRGGGRVEDRVGPRTLPNPRQPSTSMDLARLILVAKTWNTDPGGRSARIATTSDAFLQAANMAFRRVH